MHGRDSFSVTVMNGTKYRVLGRIQDVSLPDRQIFRRFEEQIATQGQKCRSCWLWYQATFLKFRFLHSHPYLKIVKFSLSNNILIKVKIKEILRFHKTGANQVI